MAKILLIDDDPHLRTILATVFKQNGFAVVVEEDGASGLRQARRQKPDLVILDIIMPGMDGFEVAQKLHDDPNCTRIPVMILTAVDTPYGRQRARELGVAAFVTKPFEVDALINKARSLIEASATGIRGRV